MNIGDETGGGGVATISVDGVTIAGDGVNTPLSAVDLTVGGTKLFNIARSAWEAKRPGIGYFPSVADNGDGKCRFRSVGHKLITGDVLVNHDCSVAGYNGPDLSVTYVDADNFDILSLDFSATSTGYFYCAANVYRAQIQDGAKVPGSLVRSIYAVNLPAANPTPVLLTCSDFIRADYGGYGDGTYQRSHQDNSRSGVKDFVQTIATGAINFYYSSGGTITPGQMYRIDFVE